MEAGRREALLALIAARQLALASDQRQRIETEHDSERLLEWLGRAAVAASMDEVFQ